MERKDTNIRNELSGLIRIERDFAKMNQGYTYAANNEQDTGMSAEQRETLRNIASNAEVIQQEVGQIIQCLKEGVQLAAKNVTTFNQYMGKFPSQILSYSKVMQSTLEFEHSVINKGTPKQ